MFPGGNAPGLGAVAKVHHFGQKYSAEAMIGVSREETCYWAAITLPANMIREFGLQQKIDRAFTDNVSSLRIRVHWE